MRHGACTAAMRRSVAVVMCVCVCAWKAAGGGGEALPQILADAAPSCPQGRFALTQSGGDGAVRVPAQAPQEQFAVLLVAQRHDHVVDHGRGVVVGRACCQAPGQPFVSAVVAVVTVIGIGAIGPRPRPLAPGTPHPRERGIVRHGDDVGPELPLRPRADHAPHHGGVDATQHGTGHVVRVHGEDAGAAEPADHAPADQAAVGQQVGRDVVARGRRGAEGAVAGRAGAAMVMHEVSNFAHAEDSLRVHGR